MGHKIRTGHGPENTATLRDFAINQLRTAGHTNIAAALRPVRYDTRPARCCQLACVLAASDHAAMTRCEVCGNDYALAFTIETKDGARHVFDSFECAVHRMAPICEHCRVQIVGHGVEVEGHFYCGAHCAKAEGKAGIVDHVSTPA
jgi:hypothetical protein